MRDDSGWHEWHLGDSGKWMCWYASTLSFIYSCMCALQYLQACSLASFTSQSKLPKLAISIKFAFRLRNKVSGMLLLMMRVWGLFLGGMPRLKGIAISQGVNWCTCCLCLKFWWFFDERQTTFRDGVPGAVCTQISFLQFYWLKFLWDGWSNKGCEEDGGHCGK